MRLSKLEEERYERQISLISFGYEKQIQLKRARVLIVGAGGLGCPVALYLAASGVGTLGIADDDKIELSNLQRQIAYETDDVGKDKLSILATALQKRNPHIEIQSHAIRLDAASASTIIRGYDLVIDCTDNFSTRFLLNDACFFEKIPLLHGAVEEFNAQFFLFVPGKTACYRCVFPQPPTSVDIVSRSCEDLGILSVIPGVAGLIMAFEAIKFLTHMDSPIIGNLLLYDVLPQKMHTLKIKPDLACALCGNNATIKTIQQTGPGCATDVAIISTIRSNIVVTVEEARQLVQNGAVLLDVREEDEYRTQHLPNAICFPLSELSSAQTAGLNKLSQQFSRDTNLVLYCARGKRSEKAAAILQTAGYVNTVSVAGGIKAWLDPTARWTG